VEDIPHLRIDPLGVLIEDGGPIQVHKAIGEPLRFGHVLDPEKDIVVLGIAEVIGREFPCEPLVPVEIDLDLHGKPSLNTHMDETEVAVHEVEIEVQALAPSGPDEGTSLLEAARLKYGEDSHQPLLDAVALRKLPSRVLLADIRDEILKRSRMLLSHGDRMVLHAFGTL
jgi:hypothetical protein